MYYSKRKVIYFVRRRKHFEFVKNDMKNRGQHSR